MAYRIANNMIRTTKILDVKDENSTTKIFTFKDKLCLKAKPGQFLMLWIPGVDEVPLSILNVEKDGTVSVLVKRVGDATEALHKKRINDIIGIRGPFGRGFTLKTGKLLLVGGGTGLAPLIFLAKKLAVKAEKLVFIAGAKMKEELLLLDELKNFSHKENVKVVFTTEDGSYGFKGLATKPLELTLQQGERFDMIYTCGPEKMMRKVFDLAEAYKINLEASLERLMRCAIGLCGSCVIGKYRVCRDGPVLTKEQLKEVKNEFGVFKRNFEGKKVPIE